MWLLHLGICNALRSLVCIMDGTNCYSLACTPQCARIGERCWPTKLSKQHFLQFVLVLSLANICYPKPFLYRHLCHHSHQQNNRAKLKRCFTATVEATCVKLSLWLQISLIRRYSQSFRCLPCFCKRMKLRRVDMENLKHCRSISCQHSQGAFPQKILKKK